MIEKMKTRKEGNGKILRKYPRHDNHGESTLDGKVTFDGSCCAAHFGGLDTNSGT